MTVSVLVVDDSGFFRKRLREMLDSCDGIKVIGAASNGREAIDMTLKLKPDVITMDYEMPVMDGISAVKSIMEQCPTPILMFSSLTYEGARVTLNSLEAGAVDFLPKNFEEISKNSSVLKQSLAQRILSVARTNKKSTVAPASTSSVSSSNKPQATVDSTLNVLSEPKEYQSFDLVAIGTSTGGPVALQKVLAQLPEDYPIPIVLVQHMPSTFTTAFAERLSVLSKITVKEAADGDVLQAGTALLAPGGKQLMITRGGRVKVLSGDTRLQHKPSVDVTFGSAANVYANKVLAIVLTGMGEDGCEGAKLLKHKGAVVWGQDEATSTVYGMPRAVAKADLTDEILSLEQISERLLEVV